MSSSLQASPDFDALSHATGGCPMVKGGQCHLPGSCLPSSDRTRWPARVRGAIIAGLALAAWALVVAAIFGLFRTL